MDSGLMTGGREGGREGRCWKGVATQAETHTKAERLL